VPSLPALLCEGCGSCGPVRQSRHRVRNLEVTESPLAISTAPPTPTDHCRVPGARESTSPWSKPTERGRDLVPLSHAEVFTTDELTNACLERFIFLKVTDPVPLGPTRSRAGSSSWKTRGYGVGAHPVRGGPEPRRPRGQTTNVLTAATLE
jgi:hypothetical protein